MDLPRSQWTLGDGGRHRRTCGSDDAQPPWATPRHGPSSTAFPATGPRPDLAAGSPTRPARGCPWPGQTRARACGSARPRGGGTSRPVPRHKLACVSRARVLPPHRPELVQRQRPGGGRRPGFVHGPGTGERELPRRQLIDPHGPEPDAPLVELDHRLEVAGQAFVEPARGSGHAAADEVVRHLVSEHLLLGRPVAEHEISSGARGDDDRSLAGGGRDPGEVTEGLELGAIVEHDGIGRAGRVAPRVDHAACSQMRSRSSFASVSRAASSGRSVRRRKCGERSSRQPVSGGGAAAWCAQATVMQVMSRAPLIWRIPSLLEAPRRAIVTVAGQGTE